jgi:hypothetical protein
MPNEPDNISTESSVSRLGKFIQTYHSFLSSFVIGAAGLIATSIWQYRQADMAARQADTQQEVARVQAENNWKIEKANILAKNLQVLASEGSANLEQRYGVLLSLTRGKILDPELAVSYALDLGKESPEYMRSVLNNTDGKDYWRLARAFEPTCEQRYGITRQVEICKVDKLADRSAAIAEMIADEIQSTPISAKSAPMALLANEQNAQLHATRLAWLFTPALLNMYSRRQWSEIARFENSSPGAHLISALVLASARTGELVSAQEAAALDKFHADHRKWLTSYMFENNCDAECKAKLVDFMLTAYEESQGDYDLPMRTLIEQPRSKVGAALSRLHTRLLWCQVDGQDLEHFRDRVLIPAAIDIFKSEKIGVETPDDLVGLLAVAKRPREGAPLEAWKTAMALIEKKPSYAKSLESRHIAAVRERLNPTPAMKKSNFCISSPAEDNEALRKAASR